MAYKFSKGKRGLGDITFEDDVDTGIDFEADTVKLETGGAERLVVTNNDTTINNTVSLKEQDSTPNHESGHGKLYVKSSDSKLYFKNDLSSSSCFAGRNREWNLSCC